VKDKLKMIIVPGLLSLAAFFSCTTEEPPPSPAIVIIGNESFRLDDLKNTIPDELYGSVTKADLEEYMNRWIDSHILYQKGLQLGLANDPNIKRRLRELEIRLIGSAYLDSTLETQVTVSRQEIEKYYEENKDIFVRDKDEIHLKHILLPDQKTTDAVYRSLRNNRAEFDSLMVRYNANLPEDEKDLGYVTEDEVVELIWNRVRNYKIGAVTKPVQTDFGYHIFKIIDKKAAGSIKELAGVEKEIEARLMQDKIEENYNSLLTQLKSNVKIETYFDLLNRLPMDSIFVKPNAGFAQEK
jgi:hypothetical protein